MNNKMLTCSAILILLLLPGSLLAQTSQVFESNKESLVALAVYGANKELIAKGCAFVIGEELLATAYQLVSGADMAEGTTAKGKKVKIEGMVAVDRTQGVAILKMKGKMPLLKLGSSDSLAEGQKIIALGANEAGEIVSAEGSVRRLARFDEKLSVAVASLAVPAGFAGSPVFNEKAEVVGLLHVLERGATGIIPVHQWREIAKLGRVTEFKNWKKEDYLAILEGALLAGRVYYLAEDTGNAQKYLERAAK